MLVVVGLELAERVEQVALVLGHGAVDVFALARLYPALREGVRARGPDAGDDSQSGVGRALKAVVNFESRSRIKNLVSLPASSRARRRVGPSRTILSRLPLGSASIAVG
ncbi:hypothetical protein [Streptomyces sp. NPDC052107]|uniref:hypothetical protein n=1 Tax=Streptomyces sp. NPDC052107 TaxID=3155632 RepID=UPI0034191C6A